LRRSSERKQRQEGEREEIEKENRMDWLSSGGQEGEEDAVEGKKKKSSFGLWENGIKS